MGTHTCEFCTNRYRIVYHPITGNHKVTYPKRPTDLLKTHQDVYEILTEYPRSTNPELNFGYVGTSPFVDVPFFDLTRDIPPEHMHLLDGGVTKWFVIFSLNVKVKKTYLHMPDRLEVRELNKKLKGMKYPSEVNRRVHNLNVPFWKCEEFRNVTLFTGFFIVELAERAQNEPLANLWRIWIFIVR